jgi:hypothetical protein
VATTVLTSCSQGTKVRVAPTAREEPPTTAEVQATTTTSTTSSTTSTTLPPPPPTSPPTVIEQGEKIGGIAVHIGARVSALARAGEVLVSRTVVDLVAGSQIEFADRGEHELKGVPGTWRLFAVD